MTTMLLEKMIGGLGPASGDAYEALAKIPVGMKVVAEIKDQRRRSTRQHNYWFALLSTAWDNSDALKRHFGTLDNFRHVLLIRLGYCDQFKMKDGSTVAVAKSVSFAKMAPIEFSALLDATLAFFEEELGLPREQMEREHG